MTSARPAPARAHIVVALCTLSLVAALLVRIPPAAATTGEGTIVLTRHDDGDRDVVVRDLASGHERPLVADDGDDHSAVWSPDGSRVAFVRETGGQADVYVVGADGSGLVQVTEDFTNERNPNWSADGSQLVFDSDRSGSRLRQIYRVALSDLLFVEQLTFSATDEHHSPTLSPDGLFVTVVRTTPSVAGSHPQVVRVRISDRTATTLTEAPADHADPRYSPDGTRVAFTSDRGNTAGDHDVYVMAADGGDETRLTSQAAPETSPRWLPDGTGVLHAAGPVGDRDLRTVGLDGAASDLLSAASDDLGGDVQPPRDCTLTWDGGGGTTDWHGTANWDLDRAPTAGDVVCIPPSAPDVIHASGITSVAEIRAAADLTVAGGTLAVGTVALDSAVLTLSGGALGAGALVSGGEVAWHAGGTVLGPGTLTIAADAVLRMVTVGGSYWVPEGTTIAGHGTLDVGAAARVHGAGAITSSSGAAIVKDAGGETAVESALTSDGTVRVTAGTLRLPATLALSDGPAYDPATGTLRGGAYVVGDAGVLAFDAPLAIRRNAAELDLTGGATVVDSTGAAALRELASNSGRITLAGGATVPTTTPLTNTGVLEGSGAVTASLSNAGVLAPDALTVGGALTQSAGGTLRLDVAGTGDGQHSSIVVDGPANLRGSLDVVGHDAFTPAWGEGFLAVAATAATADFGVLPTALPGGLAYRPRVTSGGVRVVAADVVAPTAPVVVGGSHQRRQWSRDRTVTVRLGGASDAHSGVAGYVVAWSTSPTSVPSAADTLAGATVTSPPLADGRSHYLHVRTRDRQGLLSPTLHYGPLWIDGTAPRAARLRVPVHSLRAARRRPRIRLAVRPAADGHSGVRSATVIRRTSATGRSWRVRRTSLPTRARALTVRAAAGTTSCFRVRTVDRAGNTAAGPQTCTGTPIDSTALDRVGRRRWRVRGGARLYRGSALESTTRGATLRRRGVSARRIALVATTCRRCGAVRVLVGGRPVGRRISLTSARTRHRRVVPVVTFKRVRRGRVTVKVVSARRPVIIDALAVRLR